MRLILNFFGLLRVVARRFLSHIGLLAAIMAGFVVAVAIVTSIPIYAEAVGYRILRTELTKGENEETHPPFAFMYRYIGSQSGAITWDDLKPIDQYMEDRLVNRIGLPTKLMVRYASTDKLRLMTTDGFGEPLFWVNLAFATGMEDHIELLEGTFPAPSGPNEPVNVLLAEAKANELGLQIGEEYLILGPAARDPKIQLPVRISGIWTPSNPKEDYWFYDPNAFEDSLIVNEDSFTNRIATATEKPVYTALWYAIMDGEGVRSSDALQLTANINRSLTEAAGLLPGTSLSLSPYNALLAHQRQVRFLTILLTVFSIPLLGVAAYFIILVTGMVVQQQQNEIAVLRSRGTSRLQVLWIYLLEGLLLGSVALLLGPPLGQQAARLMTWTRAFLDFVPREGMPVELTPRIWFNGAQVIALAVLSSLLPALIATRYTIVSYKLERARSVRAPLWQRLFIDILLLVPVYYGYRQLADRGTISFLGYNTPGGDPFQNPLLLLVPTLFVFAFALFSLRLFPILMNALAWICSQFPGTAVLLAMRYLARTARGYTGPIMLLIITMSLATFTSSMSQTLDQYLYDRAYYTSGTDLRLNDLGEDTAPPDIGFGAPQNGQAAATDAESDDVNEARWLFVPVTDYLTIPGITGATRVGRSEVEAQVNNLFEPGIFLGVDRADLPGVVGKAFRSDYARTSLGDLMNRLADDPGALLVSSGFMGKYGLRIGDRVSLDMNTFGTTQRVPFVVVGDLGLFPTLYEDKPFFIGNLDYVFEMQGGQYPYEVWTTITPGTDPEVIIDETEARGLRVFLQDNAQALIDKELIRPERQGVFGLLSVGFLAAAFLTVLGFLFYSVLSFRRRFVELGMLRAIGLSVGQMATLLTCEQGLIIGIGMGIGTLLGITASRLFIPFLQVRGDLHPQTPPFVVEIAWSQISIIYAIFGSMLVMAVIITMILLARMRIFQAVKLGEAV